jgi:hypothetical protein
MSCPLNRAHAHRQLQCTWPLACDGATYREPPRSEADLLREEIEMLRKDLKASRREATVWGGAVCFYMVLTLVDLLWW